MKAVVTIEFYNIEKWEQWEDETLDEMISSLKEEMELTIDTNFGFDKLNVEIIDND
jgi:hypothetical protein